MLIEIPRQSETPLIFHGNRMHDVQGDPLDKYQRGYVMTLYSRDEGGFVIDICYNSTHKFEYVTHYAIQGQTPAMVGKALTRFLVTHDPADVLLGFPAGDQFKGRMDRTAERLGAMLSSLAHDIMSALVKS